MISLESVAPPGLELQAETTAETVAETEDLDAEPVSEQPEQAEQAEQAEQEEQVAEPVELPAPKRRGRPKAEPKAEPKKPKAAEPATPRAKAVTRKAAPKTAVRMKKPVVYESSSEEDLPLTKEDMDTMVLGYLLQRKRAQQDHRRTMWAQMAGLS